MLIEDLPMADVHEGSCSRCRGRRLSHLHEQQLQRRLPAGRALAGRRPGASHAPARTPDDLVARDFPLP
ncbi:MAG: hypothetical protein R2838_08815 [Caldilineaceae bacterium]